MTLLDCTSCAVATITVFSLQGSDEGDPAFRSQLQSFPSEVNCSLLSYRIRSLVLVCSKRLVLVYSKRLVLVCSKRLVLVCSKRLRKVNQLWTFLLNFRIILNDLL
jgi:hypothetical protein